MLLRGFVADLYGLASQHDLRDDGYASNDSDERELVYAYYERIGYPYWHWQS